MAQYHLEMTVNGNSVALDIDPGLRLLDVLRDCLHLTGTKEGCSEGECGACSVILDGELVDSCLVFAPQASGREVITIEGVARNGELDYLQQAFLDAGAVQCGYCTPGMILAAKVLLDRNPHPTRQEILKAISGNICRCTGYTKMVQGVELAAASKEAKEGAARA
ncbi:(2Fe-2S)-binding protein [Desulfosporosinus youngiae]|uniref:Aerobic-type carbon monoxide dehydrogenase, small subunit CoxS/CutS-like protein n=1 Tax=Desulfosporosinus youngiae DSM 17734 TaxID=768710 RepID=H5Y1H3_9FIRM|nr:(2Fe-2S)-binding protein [Desulfosporosinus youngiae]EHQ87586.1 aerobic-type carbon monoxide dehydrogenase, small subunit CoxS/CutS-like protein [Desulfosporosinus youngiae DSM 17734]